MSSSSDDVVLAFNGAINARNVDRLAELMTSDHRFVDAAGGSIDGRAACLEAWRGFFDAYPDYRNDFEHLTADGDEVVVQGRSHCSEPALDGPALWHATAEDGRIRSWRVLDDTAANRTQLGISSGS